MTPRISIIVPCYNGEKYLRETLDCLRKQTIEDWECIMVNDGSSDGSLAIMKEYAAKDCRYRYIDKKNEKLSVARNTAISVSSGKYILPLDADDLIAPSYAEKAIDYLESHEDCKLVYCRAKFFGDIEGDWDLPSYSYEEELFGNRIFCSCIYRRRDYDISKGYNPNMTVRYEDWDFLISLLDENDKVYCIPEVLFHYRRHGKSMDTNDKDIKALSILQMVLNHPEKYMNNLERTYEMLLSNSHYQSEIDRIRHSLSFRLGRCILYPLLMCKKLVSRLSVKHNNQEGNQ